MRTMPGVWDLIKIDINLKFAAVSKSSFLENLRKEINALLDEAKKFRVIEDQTVALKEAASVLRILGSLSRREVTSLYKLPASPKLSKHCTNNIIHQ